MAVPPEMDQVAGGAIKSGYRWELDRAIRTASYLRVFFSVILLIYAGFGPGVLMRFPVSVGGVRLETVSQFYAYRPVVFALLFIALVAVLAALARRAFALFEAALTEDGPQPGLRRRYIDRLQPSRFPFVLSGNAFVDIAIMIINLMTYSFWSVLLVETVPAGMGTYQAVGVVFGSYGLFGAIIITGFTWSGLARTSRALKASRPERPPV